MFHQTIEKLTISPDDMLCVRNEEFIGRGWRTPDGTFEWNRDDVLRPATRIYHFYRLSVRYLIGQELNNKTHFSKPASLFFLSAAAIPRPLNSMVKEILDKGPEQVPRMVYK